MKLGFLMMGLFAVLSADAGVYGPADTRTAGSVLWGNGFSYTGTVHFSESAISLSNHYIEGGTITVQMSATATFNSVETLVDFLVESPTKVWNISRIEASMTDTYIVAGPTGTVRIRLFSDPSSRLTTYRMSYEEPAIAPLYFTNEQRVLINNIQGEEREVQCGEPFTVGLSQIITIWMLGTNSGSIFRLTSEAALELLGYELEDMNGNPMFGNHKLLSESGAIYPRYPDILGIQATEDGLPKVLWYGVTSQSYSVEATPELGSDYWIPDTYPNLGYSHPQGLITNRLWGQTGTNSFTLTNPEQMEAVRLKIFQH